MYHHHTYTVFKLIINLIINNASSVSNINSNLISYFVTLLTTVTLQLVKNYRISLYIATLN